MVVDILCIVNTDSEQDSGEDTDLDEPDFETHFILVKTLTTSDSIS